MNLFVTGIGTGVGKTIVAAILVEALQADYWKPVQTGFPEDSDTRTVRELVSNAKSRFHQEAYCYKEPASPDYAAALEHDRIDMDQIKLPQFDNEHIIIEGAGGLMVPLNEQDLMLNLIKHLSSQAVVVSNDYLGSINHTLLTIESLKSRNIPIAGIVFNGTAMQAARDSILRFSNCKLIGELNWEEQFDSMKISGYALTLRKNLIV